MSEYYSPYCQVCDIFGPGGEKTCPICGGAVESEANREVRLVLEKQKNPRPSDRVCPNCDARGGVEFDNGEFQCSHCAFNEGTAYM